MRKDWMTPLVYAFVGDAVWEVYVRAHVLAKGAGKMRDIHLRCSRYSRASAQASVLRFLESRLTEEEKEWVRRGRNAKSGHVPKNADLMEYRYSTAFEALLGHLSVDGQNQRLEYIVQSALAWLDEQDHH
ncbi:ribonuclease-3 family protein [Alicyclobacillus tengchongensis]|uniref:Mini-ribonuclease 3 n=1 Tax=Alicyclobacillus tolerans TaxID=90970 RepID=A0ABT9LW32_9BACL|nr:ribonuclease III domain-containing protein [Alicyclobacillus sp. TC]MDP9728483.1 ribonuclease-3 family protein [Alicyclobacillus tengchongensis]